MATLSIIGVPKFAAFTIMLFVVALLALAIHTHALITTEPPPNISWVSTRRGDVTCVDWSPQGDMIAIGIKWGDLSGNHGKVLVFAKNGSLLWSTNDLGALVYAVAWSPNGTVLAAGAGDKVLFFDINGYLLLESPALGGTVRSIRWSLDGTKIAVGAGTKIVLISASGDIIWQRELGGPVKSVAWNPQYNKIAVGIGISKPGTNYGKLLMLDINGTILWQTKKYKFSINDVSWNPTDETIIVGVSWGGPLTGEFGKVMAFDSSGNLIWQISAKGPVYAVAWSPNGDKFAVGGKFNNIIIYDKNLYKIWQSPNTDGFTNSLAWSPDGTYLTAGIENDEIGDNFESKIITYSFNEFGFLVIIGANCCSINASLIDTNIGTKLNILIKPNDVVVLYGRGTIKIKLDNNKLTIIPSSINIKVVNSKITIINLNKIITNYSVKTTETTKTQTTTTTTSTTDTTKTNIDTKVQEVTKTTTHHANTNKHNNTYTGQKDTETIRDINTSLIVIMALFIIILLASIIKK